LFATGALAAIRYVKLHGTKHRPWLATRRSTKVAANSPDLALSSPPRADAVKVGRRASRAAKSDLARPHLDVGEHGGTLAPCRGEADLDRLCEPHQADHTQPRHRSQFC
jgi:hypothetical protein